MTIHVSAPGAPQSGQPTPRRVWDEANQVYYEPTLTTRDKRGKYARRPRPPKAWVQLMLPYPLAS
jgi:hypothetical protein